MREYYYLVSSLPMLEFGMNMPFPYNSFISQCEEQLESPGLALIKRASISAPEYYNERPGLLRQWNFFDMCLRNELVRCRSGKLSKDAFQYTRGEDCSDPFLSSFARWAINEESPLETELAIDRMRWLKIEELKKGHYFDIDYLVAYALELQILERWQRINSDNGMKVLENLVRQKT